MWYWWFRIAISFVSRLFVLFLASNVQRQCTALDWLIKSHYLLHIPIATGELNERAETKNYFHGSWCFVFFVYLKTSFSLESKLLLYMVLLSISIQTFACCISGSSSENVYYNEWIGVHDSVHVAGVDRTWQLQDLVQESNDNSSLILTMIQVHDSCRNSTVHFLQDTVNLSSVRKLHVHVSIWGCLIFLWHVYL